jgi:hypothetical protein
MFDGSLGKASLSNHIEEDFEGPNVNRLASRSFICFANFRSPFIKIEDLG